jgi:hypothetical protein
MENQTKVWAEKSDLPQKANYVFWDDLCVQIIKEKLYEKD